MQARKYILKGRVQGVGFRYFACRQADALGVCGWVRNLPNGDVEVHAEGDETVLSALEDRLQEGPFAGTVDELNRDQAPVQNHRDFSIRR